MIKLVAHHGATNGATRGADFGATRGVRTAPCSLAKPGEHGAGTELPGGFGARRHFPDALPRPHGASNGASHGAPRGATYGANIGTPLDAAAVVYRLEEAGTTLLCLPDTGHSTRLRTSSFEVLASAIEARDIPTADATRLRPQPPDSARIDRMDEAWAWLALIPRDRHVLRRIVGARSLVSPTTERHVYSWRRLGLAMGADHKAVQRWHAQGISLIVAALRR